MSGGDRTWDNSQFDGDLFFNEENDEVFTGVNDTEVGLSQTPVSHLIDSHNVHEGMDMLLDSGNATSMDNLGDTFMRSSNGISSRANSLENDVWLSSNTLSSFHNVNAANMRDNMSNTPNNMNNLGNMNHHTRGNSINMGGMALHMNMNNNRQGVPSAFHAFNQMNHSNSSQNLRNDIFDQVHYNTLHNSGTSRSGSSSSSSSSSNNINNIGGNNSSHSSSSSSIDLQQQQQQQQYDQDAYNQPVAQDNNPMTRRNTNIHVADMQRHTDVINDAINNDLNFDSMAMQQQFNQSHNNQMNINPNVMHANYLGMRVPQQQQQGNMPPMNINAILPNTSTHMPQSYNNNTMQGGHPTMRGYGQVGTTLANGLNGNNNMNMNMMNTNMLGKTNTNIMSNPSSVGYTASTTQLKNHGALSTNNSSIPMQIPTSGLHHLYLNRNFAQNTEVNVVPSSMNAGGQYRDVVTESGFSVNNIISANPLEPTPQYTRRMQQATMELVMQHQETIKVEAAKLEAKRLLEKEEKDILAAASAAMANRTIESGLLTGTSSNDEGRGDSDIDELGSDNEHDEETDNDINNHSNDGGVKMRRISKTQQIEINHKDSTIIKGGKKALKTMNTGVASPINISNSKESTDVKAKEKNREHAKNTRMRKKTYIESLKEKVTELSEVRESLDQQRRKELQYRANIMDARKKSINDFLVCRTYGELNPVIWSRFLDKNFEMYLPVTPYRSFPPSEVHEGRRAVRGIPAIVADTASLAVLFKSIGKPMNDGFYVRATFYTLNEETICAGDRVMCKWYVCTDNAMERGSESEVVKHGMLVADFAPAPSAIIQKMEITFDVMNFMQQLRRASGSVGFRVVPNIHRVASEMSYYTDSRILMKKDEKMTIEKVNQKWEDTFGYSSEEVVGKTEDILHGEETDQHLLRQMMTEINYHRPGCGFITFYTKKGTKHVVWKEFYPIFTDGQVSHYLGVMTVVEKPTPAPLIVVQPTMAVTNEGTLAATPHESNELTTITPTSCMSGSSNGDTNTTTNSKKTDSSKDGTDGGDTAINTTSGSSTTSSSESK
jgi:PAS domain S-box-containing protein